MKKLNSLRNGLCMVFFVACLSTYASGQSAENRNRLATINGGGSVVRWDVSVPYSSLTMTVSAPDGRVFRKEFKSGISPDFTAIDKNGERLPDGQYNYELRLTPNFSPGVKEELAKVRARENAPAATTELAKGSSMSESLVQKDDAANTLLDMRKRGLLPDELPVQSGSFSIINGSVVVAGAFEGTNSRPPREVEPRPTKKAPEVSRLQSPPPGGTLAKVKQHHLIMNAVPDDVIPDDLIVQGSACVGLDCVNGESFGFDTIRLKENNTRIKFEDTSSSVGFPTTDWQLTANDSASGGANKFSIEDITGSKVPFTITAGALNNSIFVDSSSRLGLKTSTPVLDIHANNNNTPALRLEQNNSGGFTAQTWDVGANEANFFVRDVTGGSKLSFRIRPGAPTSSIDIGASGNVGIGTGSPTRGKMEILQTSDTVNGGLALVNSAIIQSARLWIDPSNIAHFDVNSAANGTLAINGSGTGFVGIGTNAPTDNLSVNGTASKPGGGSWAVFSDERLKNIKGNFNSGLKAVMQLQPLRYEYKRENALGLKSLGEHIGFGAQALQKIIPEAVTSTSAGYLQVNNDPIIWTMLNAIKEQQKEIEQLKGEVRKLRARSHRRR